MNSARELTARGTYFSVKLSFLQFLAAIMVVAIHTTTVSFNNHMPANIFEHIQYLGFVNISAWAVPFFFASSAFMLFRSYKLADTKTVYMKKALRLCWPFVIWSMLYEMLVVGNEILTGNHYVFNAKDTVINILFYKGNAALWFLPMLVLCTLLCPLIYLMLKNKKIGVLVLIAAAAVNFVPAVPAGAHPDALLFYMFGAYMGMHYTENAAKKNKKGVAAVFLAIFIAESILYSFTEGTFVGRNTIHRMILLISVWFIPDLLKKIPRHSYYDVTYFIYLFHIFAMYCLNISLRPIYNIITNNSAPLNLLLLYFAKIAVTVLISTAVGCFIKKHIKWLWTLLTGEDVAAVKK